MLTTIFPEGIRLDETSKKLLDFRILDVEKWILEMIEGQINHCRLELVKEWTQKLNSDDSIESIPTNVDKFVQMVISRSDYKTRKQKEAEEKAKREATFKVE